VQEIFEIGQIEPTIGRSYALRASSWESAAVYYPETFADSLYSLGLSDNDIAQALAQRDDIAPVVRRIDEWEEAQLTGVMHSDGGASVRNEAAIERRSALDRLRDWWRGREIREQESTELEVKVPLWTFGAPTIQGCSASVEHGHKRGTALSFGVRLAGSGLGGSAEFHTSTIWTFHASSGHVKVVFISTSVRVARVIVMEDGKAISEGFRVDAIASVPTEPAVLVLPGSTNLPTTEVARAYPLAHDTTGDVAEYKYMYEGTNSKSFGIDVKAFSTGVSVKSSVKISGSLALTYQLKGGFDYELRYLHKGHGLVWSSPAAPS
jgi:hypothetical protein